MSKDEALECLDNVFTELLIKKQCGEKYIEAIKELIIYLKHYRNGFERELEKK